MDSIRADVALVSRGLASSRERAQSLIRAGLVKLNGAMLEKPSVKVSESDILAVAGSDCPYVSRGGLKLEKALDAFSVSPDGQICMDVGASTGGFTDVLLRRGAELVYAIDVGTGQLVPEIAENPRVVSMEHTNARALEREMFAPAPTLAVMDVSFISIKLILPALKRVMGADGRLVALIKPQFEAGPAALGKKGVVTSARVHERVLAEIAAFAPNAGWQLRALDFSPIAGGSGNLEFWGDFLSIERCEALPPDEKAVRALVDRAHRMIK